MTAATRLLLALALAVALGGCSSTDPDRDASPDGDADGDADGDDGGGGDEALRVMTWNVENFPKASGTVEAVAEIATGIEPDVLALQEVAEPSAFEQLLAAMPGYGGLLNDDPGAFTRVGLVYRESHIEVLQSATIFGDNSSAFPRPPLVATLRTRSAGEAHDLVVVVVHLKANLDDESEARRRTACEQLEGWISAQVERGGETDFVVLGDWNDELTDPPASQVFTAFLDYPEEYSFLTMDLAEAGEHSYIPFRSFLDHLLVTASALELYGEGRTSVLHLEELVPGYEGTVSDHRPVLAVFDLP